MRIRSGLPSLVVFGETEQSEDMDVCVVSVPIDVFEVSVALDEGALELPLSSLQATVNDDRQAVRSERIRREELDVMITPEEIK